MTFDRFDVCEAWYLYLSTHHAGQNSREYARLSKLTRHFKPRPSLRRCNDLSENGLEIYLKLVGSTLPLVDDALEGGELYEMWAGAYGDTKVLVRADSFESAFEVLVEWLDDNAPGCLTSIDYNEAAHACGYASLAQAEELDQANRVIDYAEADMTVVGHATLKNGNAIPSHEWGGCEVEL